MISSHLLTAMIELTNKSQCFDYLEIDVMQQVTSIYDKSNGFLGSDGNGGSINGELSNKGIKSVNDGLKLNTT